MKLTRLLAATRKGVLAMLEQDQRYGNAPLLLPRSSRGVIARDARLAPDTGLTTTDIGIDTQRSEEHTSELQSLMRISYAVFCLKKKKKTKDYKTTELHH